MALPDRIVPLCDLLLGAAHADNQFHNRERDEVRDLLADLSGEPLSAELEARIAGFDPAAFDVREVAAAFRDDSDDDKQRILYLVAAINDADEEIDFDEDDYLKALGAALGLPAEALKGLALEVEIEDLRADLAKLRKLPPPPPPARKKAESVDVDLD